MLGAFNYDNDLKKELQNTNYIFDDTDNNISHLNHVFGSTTGLYWVWKNANHDIVGQNTYRLGWGNYFNNTKYVDNAIYVPSAIDITKNAYINTMNIYHHYGYCHGYNSIIYLQNIATQNDLWLSSNMIENLKTETFLYPYNMFIAKKNIFDKICQLWFEIVSYFYISFYDIIPNDQQFRIIDFLSERIFHIIFTNINQLIENVKIITVPTSFELSHIY
jgi:hypothetical protein